MDSLSGVGVIDKSVAILEALAERGPSSLAELVEATGFSRPTTHRLAVALETHGLVSAATSGAGSGSGCGSRRGVASACRCSAPVIEHGRRRWSPTCATRRARARSSTCATGDHRVCVAVGRAAVRAAGHRAVGRAPLRWSPAPGPRCCSRGPIPRSGRPGRARRRWRRSAGGAGRPRSRSASPGSRASAHRCGRRDGRR